MLFVHGTSEEHLFGNRPFPEEKCPKCRQAGGVIIVFCYRYAHLYWLPILGWKKTFGYCAVCKNRLEDTSFSMRLHANIKEEWGIKKYRVPLYAYAWLIILVACYLAFKVIWTSDSWVEN